MCWGVGGVEVAHSLFYNSPDTSPHTHEKSEKFWYKVNDEVCMGQYGWWGFWEIFGSLGRWVKYGWNMKGVG